MNKDEIAGLVERLMSKVFGNLTPGAIDHADLDGMAFLVEDAADALTTLSAENERLIEANRLRMEETHKERAEAKLWFEKAQEWKACVDVLEAALRGMIDEYVCNVDSFRTGGFYSDPRKDDCVVNAEAALESQHD
jgi:hypothetical protein